ncbi:ceramidase [Culex quinquefasciatus]|uniref:Neutral ceramidase n=1 Tax=Culex quinquefasciatus TaxID=7176 RepID=B0XLL1_CULQU|nr:ceramidase [Culex quinquefasciatus]|eukprot:XP_001870533.1 ceramidase [Culex quinquefasciatus]
MTKRTNRTWVAVTWLAILLADGAITTAEAAYRLGVGRADCTGPPVEIGFMGYAEFSQRGHGIHLRQFSRAFIAEDELGERVVFVSADAGMMGHAVKRDVIDLLQQKYGDVYRMENVVLSGTHSHSVPSGFLMSFLYDIASLGFVPQNFNALVEGITLSIVRAHESMRAGRLYVSETDVQEASINRSPSAYENNPKKERAQYRDYTDKKLQANHALNGVVFDGHPFRMYFGDVQEQPQESYHKGDLVRASFVAGNPRNNLMHEKTYFTVEKLVAPDSWKVVATDANWETRFRWIRKSTLFAYSDIEFDWQTDEQTEQGTYRIQHFALVNLSSHGSFHCFKMAALAVAGLSRRALSNCIRSLRSLRETALFFCVPLWFVQLSVIDSMQQQQQSLSTVRVESIVLGVVVQKVPGLQLIKKC